jgi:hypothetical protein
MVPRCLSHTRAGPALRRAIRSACGGPLPAQLKHEHRTKLRRARAKLSVSSQDERVTIPPHSQARRHQ